MTIGWSMRATAPASSVSARSCSATRDLTSYEPVLVALRLAADDPEREQRIARASAQAAAVPFEIAQVGAELAALAARSVSQGSRHLEGDATTAAMLAEAACRAAVRLVEINLRRRRRRSHGLPTRDGLAREAASAREQALAARLENGA